MGVERNLPLVRERKQAILAGDPERVAEQKKLGKLTARERIGLLLDEASFVELDVLAGRDGASGVVTGYGLIDGRPAYVYAQDFTSFSGAVGAEQARKIIKVMDLAAKTGSPIIAMFDSMGARVKEGIDAVDAYAQIAAKTAKVSGVIPQIALVLGQCAASAAMIATLNDIVIVADDGRLFVNGPQVVSANTGETVDAKALGGPEACAKNGICHLTASSDAEAIALSRRVLKMLPANNIEDAPIDFTQVDDINRLTPEFETIDTVEDMNAVINSIADEGSVIELSPAFAPEMITALGSIGGRTVGFVATQPAINGGALTCLGSRKAARFIRMLDCFNISVVTICDSTGLAVHKASEQGELAKATAQLTCALNDVSTPRVALVTGNAIAASFMVMVSKCSCDMVFAWPGSVISPLASKAAVQVLMFDRLKGAADPVKVRAELEKEYEDNVADCVNAAKQGYVDDVIEPSQTRQMIASALEMLSSKRDSRLPKKHGNLPL
ncbi:MAG: carboxyl transferase domain-containing protein [Clostridia bacterium]|nr:carboxyl transferase domain-containing protein [Clostridia bacterium]